MPGESAGAEAPQGVVADGEGSGATGGGARPVRKRRRLAVVGAGTCVVAVLVGLAGVANPWHLTYLAARRTWPLVWVLAVAGFAALWSATVASARVRWAGYFVAVLTVAAGAGLLWLQDEFDDTVSRITVANPHGDVDVELVGDFGTMEVWLTADRGLLSREHLVVVLSGGDSGPPAVAARLRGPDELVMVDQSGEAYRVTFDPGDLDVREETCRPRSEEYLAAYCRT